MGKPFLPRQSALQIRGATIYDEKLWLVLGSIHPTSKFYRFNLPCLNRYTCRYILRNCNPAPAAFRLDRARRVQEGAIFGDTGMVGIRLLSGCHPISFLLLETSTDQVIHDSASRGATIVKEWRPFSSSGRKTCRSYWFYLPSAERT